MSTEKNAPRRAPLGNGLVDLPSGQTAVLCGNKVVIVTIRNAKGERIPAWQANSAAAQLRRQGGGS